MSSFDEVSGKISRKPDFSRISKKPGVEVKTKNVLTISIPYTVAGISARVRELVEGRARLWLTNLGSRGSTPLTDGVDGEELRYTLFEAQDAPKPPVWKVWEKQAPPIERPRTFEESGVLLTAETDQDLSDVLGILGHENLIDMGERTILLVGKSMQNVRLALGKKLLLPEQQAHSSVEELRVAADQTVVPGLRFIIGKTSVIGDGPDANTREQAADHFLNLEIGVRRIWQNLCFLTGQQTPIPAFAVSLLKQERGTSQFIGAAVEMATNKKKSWDSRVTHQKTGAIGMKFDLASLQQSVEGAQHMFIHELAHAITVSVADNELLSEGMAEAITYLYYEVFGGRFYESAGSPGVRMLSGERQGFDIGNRAEACEPFGFHNFSGCIGASAIQECLGSTVEQRVQNLRGLVSASRTQVRQSKNIMEGPGHVLTDMKSVQEWYDQVDLHAPGLGQRLKEHPFLQPAVPGQACALWMPWSQRDPRGWGMAASYRFLTKGEVDESKKAAFADPTKATVATKVQPLPLPVRIISIAGPMPMPLRTGVQFINPESIAMSVPQEHLPILFAPFDVEVQVEGKWQKVVTNSTLRPQDIADIVNDARLVTHPTPDLQVLLSPPEAVPPPSSISLAPGAWDNAPISLNPEQITDIWKNIGNADKE